MAKLFIYGRKHPWKVVYTVSSKQHDRWATQAHPITALMFLMISVLLICVVFCVVGLGLFVFVLCVVVLRSGVRVVHFVLSWCVFMYLVPSSDVHYEFRIQTMFYLVLLSFCSGRSQVLYSVACVYLHIVVSNTCAWLYESITKFFCMYFNKIGVNINSSMQILYVIQLSDRVYNVTFPA